MGCTNLASSVYIGGMRKAGYHQRTKRIQPVGVGGSLQRKMATARRTVACVRGYHHHCGIRSANTVASSPMSTRYAQVSTSAAATRDSGFEAEDSRWRDGVGAGPLGPSCGAGDVSASGIRRLWGGTSMAPKVVIAPGSERPFCPIDLA